MTSSSLRMRVVEAGARALERNGLLGNWGSALAEEALDAMLDCLTENADEWHEQAERLRHHGSAWENTPELLAVLRERDE